MNIAQTILRQIGQGNMMRVGARELLAGPDFLRFRFTPEAAGSTGPARGRYVCQVTLDPLDTYTVEVLETRKHGLEVRTWATFSGVHADQLGDLVEGFSRREGFVKAAKFASL